MNAKTILFLGPLVVAAGCGEPNPAPATAALPAQYFDLRKLLDEQREYLESVSPTVIRTVRAGTGPPEVQRVSRVNWERELHFFYEADLNRPALRGRYAHTTAALPAGGRRHTYQRQPARGAAAIRELTVDVTAGGTVYRVTAVQDERNALFASERRLALDLTPAPDHNRLVRYAVDGQQKLVFFAPTTYAVQGDIE